MPDVDVKDRKPSYIELESVHALPEVAKITSLSEDTLRRRYSHFLIKLSARRVGMKLRHALGIASGNINA